ncbi:hypothetical protein Gpo141_00002983 [Globisporangium polare]
MHLVLLGLEWIESYSEPLQYWAKLNESTGVSIASLQQRPVSEVAACNNGVSAGLGTVAISLGKGYWEHHFGTNNIPWENCDPNGQGMKPKQRFDYGFHMTPGHVGRLEPLLELGLPHGARGRRHTRERGRLPPTLSLGPPEHRLEALGQVQGHQLGT